MAALNPPEPDFQENEGLGYEFVNLIQGSFSQGDLKFRETAGKQCVCNSVMSLIWSKIKHVPWWNSLDLDHILDEGDRLYKNLKLDRYLSVEDIPQNCILHDQNVSIKFVDNYSGLVDESHEAHFCNVFRTAARDIRTGLLLFVNHYCISLTFGKKAIYVFDSHSRNHLGQPVENGYSMLIKFRQLNDVVRYVHKTYFSDRSRTTLPFQINSIEIDMEEKSITNIKAAWKKVKDQNIRKRVNTGSVEDLHNKKRKRLEKRTLPKDETNRRLEKRTLPKDETNCLNMEHNNMILNFKRKVREGPFFICAVCQRSLYQNSVVPFSPCNYDIENNLFYSPVVNFDGRQYVCRTCHLKLKKKKLPCQAVHNKLDLQQIPDELTALNRLERVLISRRLLFKKVVIMPKGQAPKMKGAICNVPIETDQVCNILPRDANSSGFVLIRLKRKLSYRGHEFFEPVRPDYVRAALQYLKDNNPLYKEVQIDVSNIASELLNFEEDKQTSPFVDEKNGLDEDENPGDMDRLGSNQTMLISNIPFQVENEDTIAIAPCEGKIPISILMDPFCEELAFPNLFPKGQFGCNIQRDVKLTPTKYFNQRLLNYKQRFASDPDYIFFALSVLQQLSLNSSINIAMKKVTSRGITAGLLSSNYNEIIKSFITQDRGFSFMSSVKGTPAYWKTFLFDVLAMIRQLGLPTYFMTLSCADLRWNELVAIISKLNGKNITEEEIESLTYFERCNILNSNPVLLARHFQYRVEVFFKDIIMAQNSPLKQVKCYSIRVEFQVRGSPHIHAFLWVPTAPQLSMETKDEYIKFVDSVIKASKPNDHLSPELAHLVSKYQVHKHSKSCRKYKNGECRYAFGRFFSDRTIIAIPIPPSTPPGQKNAILQKREKLLGRVQSFIDTNLDPTKLNFKEGMDIKDILADLGLSETDYYNALSISVDDDFHIFLKRPPNSCFINNYFETGLQAWEANIDIQPVFNYYKAVSYMCAYFSKSEDATSEAMQQAAKEACYQNMTKREEMKEIARAYTTSRECSVQEAVYHILPMLWLRKCSPAVVFANSNLPENRTKVFLSEKDLQALPEDSTNVFKRSMIDRYIDRPNNTFKNGKYKVVDSFCFAEFVAYYHVDYSFSDENDCQPEILSSLEKATAHPLGYPLSIPLLTSKEKLKCRKIRSVLRYHIPNAKKEPEKYAHHILFMFYPFRNESDLCSSLDGKYMTKLTEPGVQDIVNENKIRFEPYGDMVDSALCTLHQVMNTFTEPPDNVFNVTVTDDEDSPCEQHSSSSYNSYRTSPILSDDQITSMIDSLNENQMDIFLVVNKWARDYVKYSTFNTPASSVSPLHLFITGNGGCGKSYLVKTIFHSLKKTLCYNAKDAEKERVLLLAPTGIAAINIQGTTIHSALHIPIGHFGKNIPKLSDQYRSTLRNCFSEVAAIIIDEISMVSNKLLHHIHQRLLEIFGSSNSDLPFAGRTVIVVGDFFQLPPVQSKPVYSLFNDEWQNLSHLWTLFKMAELTQTVRQKGDDTFIKILNHVRTAEVDESDERTLQSRFISKDDSNYPWDALHIFAENAPAESHNFIMLQKNDNPIFVIKARDEIPPDISLSQAEKACQRQPTQTAGLSQILRVKVGARVMLTNNIDIDDRLINGQIGTIFEITSNCHGQVTQIYIKFDDVNAGTKKMTHDHYAHQNSVVPIEQVEGQIRVNPGKVSSPVIKRIQFPLILAWACTIHKVQGLSLIKAVVSFDLMKQRTFNYGQLYVALSRVTSQDGLYLVGNYDRAKIRCDPKATQEYQKLRETSMMPRIYNGHQLNGETLAISLLNSRSLKKHARKIGNLASLMSSDIILFTETQIKPGAADDVTVGAECLKDFQILYDNEDEQHNSTAFCFRPSVHTKNHEHLTAGFKLIEFTKESFLKSSITVLLLYRKHDLSVPCFLEILSYFLQSRKIDIVLGDFNINALTTSTNLLYLEENYIPLVHEPTCIYGSLLDHVYASKSFCDIVDFQTTIHTVYFSDHDAVKLVLMQKPNLS